MRLIVLAILGGGVWREQKQRAEKQERGSNIRAKLHIHILLEDRMARGILQASSIGINDLILALSSRV
jgi:hypothetical protein